MNLETRLTRDLNIEIPAKTSQITVFDPIGQLVYWSSKNHFHKVSLQSGISQIVGKTQEIIENFIINPIFNKNIYYVTINGNIGVFNAKTATDEPKIIEKFCNTLVGPFDKFLGVDQNNLAFIEKSTYKIWFFHFKVCKCWNNIVIFYPIFYAQSKFGFYVFFQTKSCILKGIIPKDREIKDFTLINDDIFWINTTNNKLWSMKKQEFTVSQNYVLKSFK